MEQSNQNTKQQTEQSSGQSEQSKQSEQPKLMDPNAVDIWLQDHGLEAVSEEDLMGIETEDSETEDSETEDSETEDSETEEEEEEKEQEAEPDETETIKPPKGYVPVKAIQEVRSENRYLKDQIKALEDKFEQFATQQQTPKEPTEDFKVLSKEEFLELTEESPREAMAYMLELQEHKDKQYQQQQQQQIQSQEIAKAKQIFSESANLMEQVAPGIFDEDSAVQEEISDFAESIGFSDDLFFLTNPETKVILPGEQSPVYLGKQAAKVFKFIVDLRNKSKDQTDTLRKQVEQELLQKFKTNKLGKFTSMSDIPSNDDDKPRSTQRLLSEKEMNKLSDKELQAYLSGT